MTRPMTVEEFIEELRAMPSHHFVMLSATQAVTGLTQRTSLEGGAAVIVR
ncbi:hypothetical protein [Nocardioides sp. R-C-SC26]|nr:hypothetical protein [Nocardioides sp. R-C-SC26]